MAEEPTEDPKEEKAEEVVAWHVLKPDEVFAELDAGPKGISDEEAAARLEEYGHNVIETRRRKPAWISFMSQFRSVLVIILLAAVVVSAYLGEVIDAAVIAAIVIINAILGFVQERKAEHALEALRKLAAPSAEVIRGGSPKMVPASELVSGDVIFVKAGDRVPADCRIIEHINLRADESALTGESTPVSKRVAALKNIDAPIAEMENMLFAGTTVVYGHGKAIVVSTGMSTEFGHIAKALAIPEEQTPLQKRLDFLGKQLGAIILVIALAIFAAGTLGGAAPTSMFIAAIALAVAAIPEGLPAVVTISLSNGMRRMAAKNAIVRKLSAVETLGSATVICSDKTGTMTMNEMTVRGLYVDGKFVEVTGEGYAPVGEFIFEGKPVNAKDYKDIELLLASGMLCNDVVAESEPMGDPTEIALYIAARKAGLDDLRKEYQRIGEVPFDSVRKMMSVTCTVGGKNVMYTKGAVESVLAKCSHILENGKSRKITDADKKRVLKINERFAQSALRVLAFAVKKSGRMEGVHESNLTFIGLQGMADPPRPEVKDAIGKCRSAGIEVVMITGDHRVTAIAVAKELSLIESEEGTVLTGEELDRLSDAQLAREVERVRVYARVNPEHKVRITEALQENGHIVAMTGDGINDAPALKRADIGVAMGLTGTDVTREAADMVLTDDNFATIVDAVEEGRGIYGNIMKFIRYLLACNIGEVLAISATMLAGILGGIPLLLMVPVQILWMNLVTDGLPAVALSAEPAEPDGMSRPPRDPKEKILSRDAMRVILVLAAIAAISAVVAFWFGAAADGIARQQTLAFTVLVILQMAIALGSRSIRPLIKVGVFKNPYIWAAIASSIVLQIAVVQLPMLNPIFHTVPLSYFDWLLIATSGIALLVGIEVAKFVAERLSKPAEKMKVTMSSWEE